MKLTTLCYLEKDGSYLMLHRDAKKNDANEGKWIGVGGHFEQGESPEDCLVREVEEETGYRLLGFAFRAVVTFVSDRWETEYMCLYTADQFEGTLALCKEGTLKWIPKKEVLNLNLWEGDRVFLQLLEERREFFSLKLEYEGERLKSCSLDGSPYSVPGLRTEGEEDSCPECGTQEQGDSSVVCTVQGGTDLQPEYSGKNNRAAPAKEKGIRLVTGGSCQGKLEFVLSRMGNCAAGDVESLVADGDFCTEEELYEKPVINHFHGYIRRCVSEEKDSMAVTERLTERNPDAWIITDEVGCGVVPVSAFERKWREAAGRAACRIAREAVQVYRVICGLSQCLKDETENR